VLGAEVFMASTFAWVVGSPMAVRVFWFLPELDEVL
jgi:hypothetical protein